MPFQQLLSFQIHTLDGGYPPSKQKFGSIFGQARGLSVPLSLSEATLTRYPISVHSKGLTVTITLLDSTLMKKEGREPVELSC